MTMRTAALYGRDLRSLTTAAEMLALRGVRPTVESAEAALAGVRAKPMPEGPTQRRSLRTWVNSVYLVLVFGGFLFKAACLQVAPHVLHVDSDPIAAVVWDPKRSPWRVVIDAYPL